MQLLCIFDGILHYSMENRRDNFNNQLGHCLFIKVFVPLKNTASTPFYDFPPLMSQRTCEVTHMYKMYSFLPYSIEPVFHSSKLITL